MTLSRFSATADNFDRVYAQVGRESRGQAKWDYSIDFLACHLIRGREKTYTRAKSEVCLCRVTQQDVRKTLPTRTARNARKKKHVLGAVGSVKE